MRISPFLLAPTLAALSACNPGAPETGTAAPSPAAATAVSDTLNDPGSGADCAGKNLRISRDNTPLVINGECGEVTITASGGSLNFDKARAIVVEGSHYTVLNTDVDTVRVVGSDNTLNLTNARRIEVSGNNNMILSRETAEIRFIGNTNTLNTDGQPQVDDRGSGNRVI
ncbi:MAG TPA: hypothetical protein DD456_07665 [Stenotrophomonas sp.]|nr:hypothetical protein [Stenotrophomonas sp.]